MHEEQQLDAVVVGAIGVDTSVFLYGEDVDFTVEANFSQNIDYVGQAGGYSARGFAQLGYRTGFIGAIGDDHNGRLIRETLERDGVESLMFTDPQGSRRSVNIMYRDGRRKNFYDGRGSMTLQPDLDASRAMLARARLAHFSIENWARYLLPVARDVGVTIACDLQDMITLEDDYRRDFIQAADILFFSGTNFADPGEVARRLLDKKPEQIIVIGLGSRGCALCTKNGVRYFGPVTLETPVIDTNGAGDGLAVGFLSSLLLEDYSPEEAILRGQITARYTCTQKATSDTLITREQLDRYFQQL